MTTAVHPYIEALLTRHARAAQVRRMRGSTNAAARRSSARTRCPCRRRATRNGASPISRRSRACSCAASRSAPMSRSMSHGRISFPKRVRGLFSSTACFRRRSRRSLPNAAYVSVRSATAGASTTQTLEPHLAQLCGVRTQCVRRAQYGPSAGRRRVIVPQNAACDQPVHLLHLATQPDIAAYPRCLVVAERGAECTVIEEYSALTSEAYLTQCGDRDRGRSERADAPHRRCNAKAGAPFHIADVRGASSRKTRSTRRRRSASARGSRAMISTSRSTAKARLRRSTGSRSSASRQLADTHTPIDHAKPNGRSAQLHKTIVGGAAHAVFNGKILVRPGRAADRLVAAEPESAPVRQRARSTPSRSSRSSPTT